MIAAAAAAVLAATGAAAEGQIKKSVSFADLDLTAEQGRATLERRVQGAVRAICATNPALESQAIAEARATCEAETAAATQAQIEAAVRQQRMQASLAGL